MQNLLRSKNSESFEQTTMQKHLDNPPTEGDKRFLRWTVTLSQLIQNNAIFIRSDCRQRQLERLFNLKSLEPLFKMISLFIIKLNPAFQIFYFVNMEAINSKAAIVSTNLLVLSIA